MAVYARRAGWVAVAGLLIAAAVGCGLGGQPWGAGGESGPVVVSADGRVLTSGGNYSECGTTSVLVASDSPTEVALSVRLVVAGPLMATCNGQSPPLQVRLDAPLGKRKLIDAATGEPLLQFSAPLLLRPKVLPPRYRLWRVQPMEAAPQQDEPGRPVAGAQQWYSPHTGASQSDAGDLVITEFPDRPFVEGPWQSPLPRSEQGWTRVQVRGVLGWAAPYSIAWRQHGIDYSIAVYPTGTGRPLLSTAQFVAIAESA